MTGEHPPIWENDMRILLTALTTLLLLAPLNSVYADSHSKQPMLTKKSAHSVAQTLDRLTTVLKSKGITIFARVDHAAGAKKVGLELRPTELLLFGNPKLGTPLMQSNQRIGIDLPLKALAWQDNEGTVWLAYPGPDYLKSKHSIGDKDKVFGNMAKALGNFSEIAVKAGDLPK